MAKRCFTWTILILCLTICSHGNSQSNDVQQWNAIENSFLNDWETMAISAWPLAYKDFFASIPAKNILQKRIVLLSSYQKKLNEINQKALSSTIRNDLQHLKYILDFQQQLAVLSMDYVNAKVDDRLPGIENIRQLPEGKRWYELFVTKYTSLAISPDSIYRYGLSETMQYAKALNKFKSSVGDDYILWESNPASIKEHYSLIANKIKVNLKDNFESVSEPEYTVQVRPIMPSTHTTPPAYYSGTDIGQDPYLNYNYYLDKHNVSDAGWLFLHEAVPGHHYHAIQLANNSRKPFFNDIVHFAYNALFEGWACYIEEYGYQAGIYTDKRMEYAYIRWNLIRSMRLCIDVGLNYYGWSNEKAADFWKSYMPDDTTLMQRELTRCVNWPAQVLSYKIGAGTLKNLKEAFLSQQKNKTDKDFHALIMQAGMVPLQLLTERIKEQ
jgi:uncharacterized protein (DUF885 family)